MTKDCSAQHYWRPRTKSVAGGGGVALVVVVRFI